MVTSELRARQTSKLTELGIRYFSFDDAPAAPTLSLREQEYHGINDYQPQFFNETDKKGSEGGTLSPF